MGLQQRGRMASGTAFFLDQPGFLIAEQVMGGAARLQHNVSAEQHDRTAVAVEVATNGHFRHPEQGGRFFQMQLIAALECLNELTDAFVTASFHIPSALKSPCGGRALAGFYLSLAG